MNKLTNVTLLASGHEQKIKRFNIREGLNIVTIALCMIMAGTGEIKTLKSLRYAYGRNHFASRYGTHVATHQALGLLFLGGGRYTLGTSNAAIAALVGAFFPSSNSQSSDNATYLQALRHLWVLAVEPRCITVTDVDTKEAVFLPVKITTQEDGKPTMLPPMLAPTLIPSLERLVSIRIDTPRYWPFYFDFQQFKTYKDNFLRSQNFFVKRRTSFLAYSEDMRGSRSLFVRSGASAGDYAILESPIVSDAMSTSKNDLMQFISSYSNDPLFLAFADHFCCDAGETEEEQKFAAYCNASLLDCLLHDKMLTIPSHLTLYHYRVMPSSSRFFNLRIKDLLFAEEFCANIFQNHFNGKREASERLPLIRWTTIKSVLHELDQRLDKLTETPEFRAALAHYVTGKAIPAAAAPAVFTLGWYLVRHSVPPSHVLMILHEFTTAAIKECLNAPPPGGTTDEVGLSRGLRQVIYATGKRVMLLYGSSWTVEACELILRAWGVM
jgi:anaphase-promoting complex subunit 1